MIYGKKNGGQIFFLFFVKMDKIRKGSDLPKEKWGSPSNQESKIAAKFSSNCLFALSRDCVTFTRKPGSTAIP